MLFGWTVGLIFLPALLVRASNKFPLVKVEFCILHTEYPLEPPFEAVACWAAGTLAELASATDARATTGALVVSSIAELDRAGCKSVTAGVDFAPTITVLLRAFSGPRISMLPRSPLSSLQTLQCYTDFNDKTAAAMGTLFVSWGTTSQKSTRRNASHASVR